MSPLHSSKPFWIMEEYPETKEVIDFFEREGFKLHYRDVWVIAFKLDGTVEKMGVRLKLCDLVANEKMLSFYWLHNWRLAEIKFHKDLGVEFIFIRTGG